MIDIVEALGDANLFGPWFSGPSWSTWRAVLRAAFHLPMDAEDLALFRALFNSGAFERGRHRLSTTPPWRKAASLPARAAALPP